MCLGSVEDWTSCAELPPFHGMAHVYGAGGSSVDLVTSAALHLDAHKSCWEALNTKPVPQARSTPTRAGAWVQRDWERLPGLTGLPGGACGKELPADAGDIRCRFDPWVGKAHPLEEEMAACSSILA